MTDRVKRNTRQKREVAEFFKNNQNIHLSVQDIRNGISSDIGLTTIYRVINELVISGDIMKKPLENSQGFCYQYNEDIRECEENTHYHLLCEVCNKLLHYENKKIKSINNEMEKDLNFTINNQRLVFYGKCNQCK